MSSITFSGIWEIIKKSGEGFKKDKVFKLSASLAYYTVFSLGPMLIVIIFLANLFWAQRAVEGNIVAQLQGLVGDTAAAQVQLVIKNASLSGGSTFTAIIGFTTLIIGATTVFSDMQSSLNFIWNLKLKESTGWWKLILSRLISFSMIIGLAFLLLVSLVISALIDGLSEKIQENFSGIAVQLIYVINLLVTLLITMLLFGLIFKVLPDAEIHWSDVAVGAAVTACLFMIAKFGITLYISHSNVASSYGAAGSLVILLLWIYFSSMILYIGAEFTKAYAMKYGKEICPNKYTTTVQTIEVESDKKSVQENERDAEKTQKETQKKKDREKQESS